MSIDLPIPSELAHAFLARCAEENIDSEQALKQLMEEFLADLEDVKIAKERDQNYQQGRSLDQLIADHALEV